MDFVMRVVDYVREDWLRTVAILVLVLVGSAIIVGFGYALVSIGGWSLLLMIVGIFAAVFSVAWAIDYLVENYG